MTISGISEQIIRAVNTILKDMGVAEPRATLEHPENILHGDLSTNAALAYAKELKMNPRELAGKILTALGDYKLEHVDKNESAGPGFINFQINPEFIGTEIVRISDDEKFGRTPVLKSKKIVVEYTDPNAFKVFHIGHLMSNSIGESISRIIDYSGATVVRLCYPSDIGLHIAKAVWAIKNNLKELPSEDTAITLRTDFLGKMYVYGTAQYEESPEVKAEIDSINKKLFEKSDKELNDIYEKGRRWSFEHFEALYKKLGTKFDGYIYESEVAEPGKKIVLAHVGKVFQESDGAIVFKGEDYGLHTRVFLNSQGLPTYEAKEIGLNTKKFADIPDIDTSIVLTGNEQNEYFKVVRKALELIDPKIGTRTHHIGHGMLRSTAGKMSSRKGNVITGESLIEEMEEMTLEKMADREMTDAEKKIVATDVAIGAIRYSILRQAPGGNIIYDPEKSVSFEGDSGPYLQYAAVRALTVIQKANEAGLKKFSIKDILPESGFINQDSFAVTAGTLERMMVRFPEMVERACKEYAPHHITGYLTELAGLFNSFYAGNKIIDPTKPAESSYRLSVTKAFATVMTNGLYLLGINVPPKM
ncbi:MAG: arginine--tRNA ligase [Patescibacteria group bacterium]